MTISGKYAFQSTNLGLQFSWGSSSILPPLVAVLLLFLFCFVLPLISSQWFLRWPQTWEKSMGIGKLKHHKTHYSYWDSAIFHEEIFPGLLQTLGYFPVIKVGSDSFYQFSYCFFVGHFHRSLLCPLFPVTLSLLMAFFETPEFVILMKPNLLIFLWLLFLVL